MSHQVLNANLKFNYKSLFDRNLKNKILKFS